MSSPIDSRAPTRQDNPNPACEGDITRRQFFTSTPEKMLDVLTRIVADRSLGKVFFNDYYLMDIELMSDPTRRAIREQAAKHGMKLLMPPLSPFHSNGWPWRIDPKDGTGPSSLYEIWKRDAK